MPQDNYDTLVKTSIKHALDQNWTEAAIINQKILESHPQDIETLNRLAKAKIELDQIKEARTLLKKIISLDKFNNIARNNLLRLDKTKTFIPKNTKTENISFIEEPGKSKIIKLTNIGDRPIVVSLQTGQSILLQPLKRRIKIITSDKQYVGSLPDDLSLILNYRIKLGSKYEAFIKSATPQDVYIFIRETKQSARLKGTPAFQANHSSTPTLSTHQPSQSPLEMFDPEMPQDS